MDRIVVGYLFGIDRFGPHKSQPPVEDMVDGLGKDAFDMMLILNGGFFKAESLPKRLEGLNTSFAPVVKITTDDHRTFMRLNHSLDLGEFIAEGGVGDEVDTVHIDDMDCLAVSKWMRGEQHTFFGAEQKLSLVCQLNMFRRKMETGCCEQTVHMAFCLHVGCHGIGEIPELMRQMFWYLVLLKKKKVAGMTEQKLMQSKLKIRV